MSVLRSDLRTRARDYLNESVADIYSDAQLNRYATEEILSLPSKDIYLEEMWSTTLSSIEDYSSGIELPDNTFKLEDLEKDEGNSSFHYWVPIKGWYVYAGALFLPYTPGNEDIRGKLKKYFTSPSDDITALDVPDDKTEIVVWGIVIRAYKQLIGYLSKSKNWDAISKPDGISIGSVQMWLRDARTDYKELVQLFATSPLPRDIDLTN